MTSTLIALGALSLVACEDVGSSGAANDDGIVVIMVDTLRADHMSLYGYGRETTPWLDARSDELLVFEHHTSQAGWTLPSVASLMTGLPPTGHGCCLRDASAGDASTEPLSTAPDTLAELLQAEGWNTSMLSRSSIIEEHMEFDQGFDDYERVNLTQETIDAGLHASGNSAGILTKRAISWVESAPEGKWFLFLHYMDPHTSYIPPDSWAGTWSGKYGSSLDGEDQTVTSLARGALSWNQADVDEIEALYDEEIGYLDSQIDRLIGRLGEGTTMILIGDHGEQFTEHGGWYHEDLWQENIHTPLVISGPGIEGGRIDARVQTIDVTSTIAAIAGIEPSPDWMGRDLTPLFDGGAVQDAPIVSEYAQQKTLTTPDGYKLMWDGSRDYQLYDLVEDPGETRDLAPQRPGEVDALSAELDQFLSESSQVAAALGI